MDGGVEVIPYQGIMLDIPQHCANQNNITDKPVRRSVLYKVLLCNIPRGEIANSINRYNSNVLNGPQKILGLRNNILL